MEHVDTGALESHWRVLAGTRRSQAAIMTIEPGGKEGGPDNRHHGDQWLYVVAGRGTARLGRKVVRLAPGSLLLIEAGEAHEIANDGAEPLKTINVYTPPEYER